MDNIYTFKFCKESPVYQLMATWRENLGCHKHCKLPSNQTSLVKESLPHILQIFQIFQIFGIFQILQIFGGWNFFHQFSNPQQAWLDSFEQKSFEPKSFETKREHSQQISPIQLVLKLFLVTSIAMISVTTGLKFLVQLGLFLLFLFDYGLPSIKK